MEGTKNRQMPIANELGLHEVPAIVAVPLLSDYEIRDQIIPTVSR